ncbi:LysR family transcriptional regulator [Parasphingorhabdus sp.]|uniref:LysR family transcriptional regulator n=1 Tax=Parasphingorhabdus sp. TaxID=2709688 RepID=UPI003002B9A7
MADLNYNHLRYFWAVAHDGNLTRTAATLNISQSALSVQIRKLEQRLGNDLFERRGRQLHLTEAGRIALDHADTIFAAGKDLLGTLSSTGEARQALRIGALATLSRNFQMSFLEPALGQDNVEIVLRSGSADELFLALEALNLDVVLTNQSAPRDNLTPFITHRIAEQKVGLIGNPKRLEGDQELDALLRDHPVILPSLGTSVRSGFDAVMERQGIRPIIAAEVDDMAMMRLLVREDAGLAVIPPIVVKDEIAAGKLLESTINLELTESFYAVTVKRKFPNLLLAMLVDRYSETNLS